MSDVRTQFEASDFFPLLEVRGPSFAHMVGHLESHPSLPLVIETGTARMQGNWGGDGQSTLIWDWTADRLPISVLSIDIDPAYVEVAKAQVKHVKFAVGDSVTTLASLPAEVLKRVGLIYLDSYDWGPAKQFESAFHHLAELASIWAHLPKGCMIVVDDCHTSYAGKHVMVHHFMKKLGIEPAFSGYQTGWIKP